MEETTVSYAMSIHSSADASEWAKLFCKVISENKDIKIDEEFMIPKYY